MNKVVKLETAAQQFVEETAEPPYLYQLEPEVGRAEVDQTQAGDIDKPDAHIEDMEIEGGPSGHISIRILRPKHTEGKLPVILYIHGAGWVFGNAHTHDRLIRELVVGSGAAVVFPNYSLAPEAQYPIALEEIYALLKWIHEHGEVRQLDQERVAVAGDSVGGNMTAVRYLGIIHDFVMLNPLRETAAAQSAISLAGSWLKGQLQS